MRLTWRDGVDTALIVLVVGAMVGVLQERAWPLLGTERAAAASIFAIGFVMCQVGMRAQVKQARDLVRGPFMLAATLLGVVALILGIVGIVFPGQTVVVALGATLVVIWAVATAHHAIGPAIWHPA